MAPYYNTRKDVKDAVDKALVCLSRKQLDDGRFQSWGTTNSESAAQVVVALSALGIDADKDTRFVKSGNSALDGLLSFAVKTGGFGHDDNVVNQMATEQAYYALARMTASTVRQTVCTTCATLCRWKMWMCKVSST